MSNEKQNYDYKTDVEWMLDNLHSVMKDFFNDEMGGITFTASDDSWFIPGDQLYNSNDVEDLMDVMSDLTDNIGSAPEPTAMNIKEVEKLIAVAILLRRQLVYQKSLKDEGEKEETGLQELKKKRRDWLARKVSDSNRITRCKNGFIKPARPKGSRKPSKPNPR